MSKLISAEELVTAIAGDSEGSWPTNSVVIIPERAVIIEQGKARKPPTPQEIRHICDDLPMSWYHCASRELKREIGELLGRPSDLAAALLGLNPAEPILYDALPDWGAADIAASRSAERLGDLVRWARNDIVSSCRVGTRSGYGRQVSPRRRGFLKIPHEVFGCPEIAWRRGVVRGDGLEFHDVGFIETAALNASGVPVRTAGRPSDEVEVRTAFLLARRAAGDEFWSLRPTERLRLVREALDSRSTAQAGRGPQINDKTIEKYDLILRDERGQ